MLVYAAVALRWAIDQFQREEVLFREAERFSLATWLRHLYRDREPTPTGTHALLCFALILASSWYFMSYFSRGDAGTGDIVLGQLFIAIPPVLMAVFLTSDPARTLRLAWPRPRYWLMAVSLAFTLNPLVNELEPIVRRLFPISETVKAALEQLLSPSTSLRTALVVFALVPAVFEELAFRGYVLSGLERQHRTRSAILLSALMFGFLHVLMSLFQQLFNATFLGIVLGLLAVRSRSLLPGILFHFLNNAMGVTRGLLIERAGDAAVVGWIYRNPGAGLYHVIWVAAGAILSSGLLFVLWKRTPDPLERPEESGPRPVSLAHHEPRDVSQPGMTPG
jgi:sodium transport system permease protein